jgi:hypothetical protein
VFVLWSAACSTDKERQPRTVKDEHNIGLVTVSASDHYLDSSLVGPAASPDEPAKPAAQAVSVAIDLSTPETTARSYVDLINAGQVQQLAQVLTADQQPIAAELGPVLAPVTESSAHLNKLLGERFAGHAIVLSLPSEAVPPDWLKRWTIVSVEVDASRQDAATATLKVENAEETATRSLVKADDGWRVEEPNLPAVDTVKAAEATIAQFAEALRGLSSQVESGQIADAAAAEQQVASVLANPGQPAPDASAESAQPTPAAANPPPARERTEYGLEQQMDDAAGRSMFGAP